MKMENMVEQLSAFVTRASYEDLSPEARRQIKVRVLDWLACAIGAVGFEPMRRLRNQIERFGGRPLATLIGDGMTSPDRAALYNGALTQHLGFNDSFLSGKALCNPSDTLPAVLAASEYRSLSGKEFLTAVAVAYQVQCRLCEVSHLVEGAVGHSTLASYAIAAGVAKALKLNREQTANAIAATIAANTAAQVPRVSGSPRYKDNLYSYSPFSMAQAVLFAISSITDTSEAFEASTRLLESVTPDFEIDWGEEDLETVRRTVIKKFNAEIYSQSAVEAILHLRERRPCHPDQIERIELDTFDVAYHLLGANAKGTLHGVRTRKEAYRSLPYLLAVALLDGEVSPRQHKTERILKEDVQSLMRKVVVRADSDFSRRFPEEMPARVRICLRDGQILVKEKLDYEGYFTRPMAWERAVEKFKDLTVFQIGYESAERIIEKVLDIEDIRVRELTELLAGASKSTEGNAQEKVFTFRKHKPAA
ncbi:MAG TPA: MmgE/PrpD family protein [Blastocatellia bacterium]|nr:MmgE/PrpD family protein [Blastocatellia bacterium]